MPTFTAHAPGSPCWVDLMSPDPEASKRFYGAVFGWEAEDRPDEEGNIVYALFSKNGQVVAGMGGQSPEMGEMPAIWSTYIAVDDPAAIAAKATEAGGSIMMPPMQVMDSGEMAILADPSGAMISIWKPGDHIGAELCNEPDTWAWNELLTRDLAAAKPFYAEVFGWTFQDMDMGPMGTYHVIEGGENNGWGGMMAMPPTMPEQVPNHWAVYFTVDDIHATIDKVKGAGGMVASDPMPIPGVGTSAAIHDPSGGSFMLLQPETTE